MKIEVKGDNVEKMYNMIPYKSKVINVDPTVYTLKTKWP